MARILIIRQSLFTSWSASAGDIVRININLDSCHVWLAHWILDARLPTLRFWCREHVILSRTEIILPPINLTYDHIWMFTWECGTICANPSCLISFDHGLRVSIPLFLDLVVFLSVILFLLVYNRLLPSIVRFYSVLIIIFCHLFVKWLTPLSTLNLLDSFNIDLTHHLKLLFVFKPARLLLAQLT